MIWNSLQLRHRRCSLYYTTQSSFLLSISQPSMQVDGPLTQLPRSAEHHNPFFCSPLWLPASTPRRPQLSRSLKPPPVCSYYYMPLHRIQMIRFQRRPGSLLSARRSPRAYIHAIPSMAVFRRKPTNQQCPSVAAQNEAEAEASDHVTDVICGLGFVVSPSCHWSDLVSRRACVLHCTARRWWSRLWMQWVKEERH